MPNNEKFLRVIQKNTFYFFDEEFEEYYEAHIESLAQTLLVVKNAVELNGLRREIFEELLLSKDNGLSVLLALTGFSNESLKRLITLIRVVDDPTLSKLSLKEKWATGVPAANIAEWSDTTIARLVKQNEFFRRGIVNIFFEGGTVPFLAYTLPLFEYKKLDIKKLSFDTNAMLDTLLRYKEKGSYSGKRNNNPETVIARIIESLDLTHEQGDLHELVTASPNTKRTMDFIIRSKSNPQVIVESSFLVTTSSGQGDKSKTEIAVAALIKKHYPKAKFIGFVDGIGWYVRKGDLARMVSAYDDVFTFRRDELDRFEKFLAVEFLENILKIAIINTCLLGVFAISQSSWLVAAFSEGLGIAVIHPIKNGCIIVRTHSKTIGSKTFAVI